MQSRREFLQDSMSAAATSALPSRLFAREPRNSLPDDWVKFDNNPILSLGSPQNFDRHNIFAPAIVKEQNKYFLFYAGGPSGPANGGTYINYQLGLALSNDGFHWKKTGKPLLPLGERDNFHATPALLRTPEGALHKVDDKWQMIYCGNRADDVELAFSTDGIHWGKNSRSPIYRKAYSPNLIQLPGEVRMYYIHKPPKVNNKARPWEIHFATGADLYSLKPHQQNPILTITQRWETGALFYPYVIKEGQTWIMLYAAYWGGQRDRVRRTAIGMATSSNGISWKKSANNPIFTPTPGSKYDSNYTSSQSIIRDGDHYKLFYGARIDGIHKYYAIGLATRKGLLHEMD